MINEIKPNLDLLQRMLSIPHPSGKEYLMVKFIREYISANFGDAVKVDEDEHGNLLITKGKLNDNEYYPCIVAHLDEVHSANKYRRVFCLDGELMVAFDMKKGEQCGLGADDAVGLFIGLTMLHEVEKLKLFFPVSEEVGCVGSSLVDLKWFNDVGYLMQPDRRGNSDLIVHTNGTEVTSDEFIDDNFEVFEHYGYTEAHGTCTDIGTLVSRGVGISACNLSCGYYNEHCHDEAIDIPSMTDCLNLVYNILLNAGLTHYEFTPKSKHYGNTSAYGAWWADKYCYDYYDDEELEELNKYYAAHDDIPCSECEHQDCMNCKYYG